MIGTLYFDTLSQALFNLFEVAGCAGQEFLFLCGRFPRTLPTLSFCHPERSRGISRHVPVDLVGWLDFARHDRMIAADRFSDSLAGDWRGGLPLLSHFLRILGFPKVTVTLLKVTVTPLKVTVMLLVYKKPASCLHEARFLSIRSRLLIYMQFLSDIFVKTDTYIIVSLFK